MCNYCKNANANAKDALTPRQRRFVAQYCVDYNASAAAIRAGYAEGSARQQGYALLQLPAVRAAIAEHLEVLTEAADVEAIRVIAEAKCIAHFNVQDILAAIQNRGTIEGLLAADREVTAAVSEITVREVPDEDGPESIIKLKFHDKLQALKLLAQIKGMMSEASTIVAGPAFSINGDQSNDDTRRLARELVRSITGSGEGEPGSPGVSGVS